MKQIVRTSYINTLIQWKDGHFVKVITGVRRSGKSTILNQYIDYLKNNGISKNQIISYDFNDPKLASLTYMELYDQILSISSKNKVNYLFLDEIQEIESFERCVIGLFEHKTIKFDICITGSNSKMFSEQLATLFTGRNLTMQVLPLSFKEFYEYYKNNYAKYKTTEYMYALRLNVFNNFMKYGGLPILLEHFNDDIMKQDLLSQVLKDTVIKDVKTRYVIKNFSEFERISKFILTESAKEISVYKTADFLRINEKSKISHKTVDKYLKYLQEALLVYKAELFNIKGRRLLNTTAKYFSVDTGIKNVQDNFSSWDSGFSIESIVYIELLRRGYSVHVGKLRNGEIDFVCSDRANKYLYIQVTKTLKNGTDKNLWDREIGNLEKIKDNFPKIVISYEDSNKILQNGIEIRNLIDWLLEV